MRFAAAAFLLVLSGLAQAFDHGTWDSLLSDHVQWVRDGHASVVDYEGLAADREQLDRYLTAIQRVGKEEFRQWSGEEQLAFLINAYNAFTADLVLEHYGDIDSIKDIGGWFRGPWDIRFFKLLERERSLDELEHTLIRGNYDEPAIHFAVNCASVGCPALRPEAYTGEKLNEQLADQRRRFLSDRTRNYYEAGENDVVLSPLIGWYEDDFIAEYGSIRRFVVQYSDLLTDSEEAQKYLVDRAAGVGIGYGDYDWSLNTLANTPLKESGE